MANRPFISGLDPIFTLIGRSLLHYAQGGLCVLCDQALPALNDTSAQPGEAITWEHIYAVSNGGEHNLSNLALSHWHCNHERGRDPLTPEQETRVMWMRARLDQALEDMGLQRTALRGRLDAMSVSLQNASEESASRPNVRRG